MSTTQARPHRSHRPQQESRRRSRWWWVGRVPWFMAVGVTCTLGYFVAYLLLREPLGAQPANLVALVVSTLAVTAGNRRYTFHVHSRRTVVAHQALGLALLLLTTVLTAGSLWVLLELDPTAGWLLEVVVLGVANAVGGCARFAAYAWAMREDREDPTH